MAKSTSKQAPTKKVAASTRTRPTIATRKRTVQSNEDHENVAPMHGGRQVAPTTRVTRSATVALTDRELNDASEPAAVASTRKSKASHRAATSVRRTVNNNDGSDEEANPYMDTPQTQSSRPPTPSTRTHATNSNRQRANVPSAVNANDVEADSEQVRELKRQLQEALAKNRILTKEKDSNIEMIARPKGTAGNKGFNLMSKMGLNKDIESDRTLYYDILASVRALAIKAGIDFDLTYKEQSMVKMGRLFQAASTSPVPRTAQEEEPYLKRFVNDWATAEIVRQYINGKRKAESAKSRGKLVGGKRKRAQAGSSGGRQTKRRCYGDEPAVGGGDGSDANIDVRDDEEPEDELEYYAPFEDPLAFNHGEESDPVDLVPSDNEDEDENGSWKGLSSDRFDAIMLEIEQQEATRGQQE